MHCAWKCFGGMKGIFIRYISNVSTAELCAAQLMYLTAPFMSQLILFSLKIKFHLSIMRIWWRIRMTNDIKGPMYFSPARGVCYSAVAMYMKGFPIQQTICIHSECSWRDSFCCHRTSRSHSRKGKHSYTNFVFNFLWHSHSSFAFALCTSGILAEVFICFSNHPPLSPIFTFIAFIVLYLFVHDLHLGSNVMYWPCSPSLAIFPSIAHFLFIAHAPLYGSRYMVPHQSPFIIDILAYRLWSWLGFRCSFLPAFSFIGCFPIWYSYSSLTPNPSAFRCLLWPMFLFIIQMSFTAPIPLYHPYSTLSPAFSFVSHILLCHPHSPLSPTFLSAAHIPLYLLPSPLSPTFCFIFHLLLYHPHSPFIFHVPLYRLHSPLLPTFPFITHISLYCQHSALPPMFLFMEYIPFIVHRPIYRLCSHSSPRWPCITHASLYCPNSLYSPGSILSFTISFITYDLLVSIIFRPASLASCVYIYEHIYVYIYISHYAARLQVIELPSYTI